MYPKDIDPPSIEFQTDRLLYKWTNSPTRLTLYASDFVGALKSFSTNQKSLIQAVTSVHVHSPTSSNGQLHFRQTTLF